MRPSRLLRGVLFALPLLVFALFGLWRLRGLLPSAQLPYGEFERRLESGQVRRVVVRGDRTTVTLRKGADIRSFNLRLPSGQATPESTLMDQLEAQDVNYRFGSPGQVLPILLKFLPVLLLLAALLLLVFRRRSAAARLPLPANFRDAKAHV